MCNFLIYYPLLTRLYPVDSTRLDAGGEYEVDVDVSEEKKKS